MATLIVVHYTRRTTKHLPILIKNDVKQLYLSLKWSSLVALLLFWVPSYLIFFFIIFKKTRSTIILLQLKLLLERHIFNLLFLITFINLN